MASGAAYTLGVKVIIKFLVVYVIYNDIDIIYWILLFWIGKFSVLIAFTRYRQRFRTLGIIMGRLLWIYTKVIVLLHLILPLLSCLITDFSSFRAFLLIIFLTVLLHFLVVFALSLLLIVSVVRYHYKLYLREHGSFWIRKTSYVTFRGYYISLVIQLHPIPK